MVTLIKTCFARLNDISVGYKNYAINIKQDLLVLKAVERNFSSRLGNKKSQWTPCSLTVCRSCRVFACNSGVIKLLNLNV